MRKSSKQLLFERMNKIGGMPIKEEEYFQEKLPNDVKRHSKKYEGRDVVWYGDPDQMIVIHKDDVHGMWGNVYDHDKLDYVKNMIINSEEKVELECSYGLGNVVSLQEIEEQHESVVGGSFETDYDGHDSPFTTGYPEVDTYLGTDDLMDHFNVTEAVGDFMVANKYAMLNGRTREQLEQEIMQVEGADGDEYEINEFLDVQEQLHEAYENNSGDINKFTVQLRDGHHRVMGAIAAGEQYVCVNLDKESIQKYQGRYKKV